MWYLEKIPKICHTFWGGDILPYIRFMTVVSFMKLNPDWQIWLWHPFRTYGDITWKSGEQEYKLTCKNYLSELMNLPINKEIVDFESLKFPIKTAEVHKADYIRINALRLYGGVWADMDIIFFKPIERLEINTIENRKIETVVCKDSYGYSTGLVMASPENKLFNTLSDLITQDFRAGAYQCIGPTMFNNRFPTIKSINDISPCVNLSMDVIYAHDSTQVHELISDSKPRFTAGSIGCHWYGGNKLWGKYLNRTDGGLIEQNDIISKVLNGQIK
jgi:mannosyltransferase OCH1-like enzyme